MITNPAIALRPVSSRFIGDKMGGLTPLAESIPLTPLNLRREEGLYGTPVDPTGFHLLIYAMAEETLLTCEASE